jgi:hypothetical protein
MARSRPAGRPRRAPEYSDEVGSAKATLQVAVTRGEMTMTRSDNRVEKFKRVQ